MSTATKEKSAPPPVVEFVPPPVEPGMIVRWHPDGIINAHDWHPAIVSRVGPRTIAVSIIDHTNHNFILRDGVRNASDEDASPYDLRENGSWSHTDSYYKVFHLERRLAELEEALGGKK
jgi:hypothetical protein